MDMQGEPFVVPEFDDSDTKEAAQSAMESELMQQRQNDASRDFFGDDYQIDQYDPAEEVEAPIVSEGRNTLRFSEPANIKCDPEKEPKFPNGQIPFSHYTPNVSKVCKHPPNSFLTWDNQKYKYCCDTQPDPLEKMLKHCKDVLYHMLHNVDYNSKSAQSLNHIIQKYLAIFRALHTVEEGVLEKQKIDALAQAYLVRLTPRNEYPELGRRSQRPRDVTMSRWQANALWSSYGGGKSRRKQQLRKKRSMVRRSKSRSRRSRNIRRK